MDNKEQAYKCCANLLIPVDGKETSYKQGQLINQEEYDNLPKQFKFKFNKVEERPGVLSDAEVRRILLDLVRRVDTIEKNLSAEDPIEKSFEPKKKG